MRHPHSVWVSRFSCVSFVVRCFPDIFLFNCSCFMASGVGMVGPFLTHQCQKQIRKSKSVLGKSFP